MQIENDYEKEVYNGDIGFVTKVDAEAQEVCVSFDGRDVVYGCGELDNLVLAYAITVHKSQGSEYPAVVLPLSTQHYPMLQRNLLYGPHPWQASRHHCRAEEGRRDRRPQRDWPQAMDQAQRLAFGVIRAPAQAAEVRARRQDALLTTLGDLPDVMRTVSTFADPSWRRSPFEGSFLHDAQKLVR